LKQTTIAAVHAVSRGKYRASGDQSQVYLNYAERS